MESNWRWFRELYAPAGFLGDSPRWDADPQLRFLAKLITPYPIIGVGIATHIAVGPRQPGGQRYWLGKLTPVGVSGPQFQWLASGITPGSNQFPILPTWPVEPDTP